MVNGGWPLPRLVLQLWCGYFHLRFTIYHLPVPHIFRTKHLPGSARTRSRISNVNNADVKSDMDTLLRSTSASICFGSSADSNWNTECSKPVTPCGTSAN